MKIRWRKYDMWIMVGLKGIQRSSTLKADGCVVGGLQLVKYSWFPFEFGRIKKGWSKVKGAGEPWGDKNNADKRVEGKNKKGESGSAGEPHEGICLRQHVWVTHNHFLVCQKLGFIYWPWAALPCFFIIYFLH